MRKLLSLAIVFSALAAAPTASAYFKVLPGEYDSIMPQIPAVTVPAALVIDGWPDWVGMPYWMQLIDAENAIPQFGDQLRTMLPNGRFYKDVWSAEGWPLWIDPPRWLE